MPNPTAIMSLSEPPPLRLHLHEKNLSRSEVSHSVRTFFANPVPSRGEVGVYDHDHSRAVIDLKRPRPMNSVPGDAPHPNLFRQLYSPLEPTCERTWVICYHVQLWTMAQQPLLKLVSAPRRCKSHKVSLKRATPGLRITLYPQVYRWARTGFVSWCLDMLQGNQRNHVTTSCAPPTFVCVPFKRIESRLNRWMVLFMLRLSMLDSQGLLCSGMTVGLKDALAVMRLTNDH